MKVVYATPEMAPFAKTGGLADVAGALPRALARQGIECTVMMPLYASARSAGVELRRLDPPEISVPLGPHSVRVELFEALTERDGPRTVLIGYDPFFDRPELYGGSDDYPDNLQRFSLFSRAVVEASDALGLEPDIFHLNDWQTSLISAYTKMLYGDNRPRTLLTIHNIGYQGVFWKWDLPWTGLGWEMFHPEAIEFHDSINLLKAGIMFSDAITTVSPTHAREITTTAEFGRGLEGTLRKRSADITGILNGIDLDAWNPARDAVIARNYSVKDLKGKTFCKTALQKELKLPVKRKSPLLAFIGRLTEQKGLRLLLGIADELLEGVSDLTMVVLGVGDPAIEEDLRALERRHPKRVRSLIEFNDDLAHRIIAGADMMAMPSLYEPCGLTQLYGVQYGSLPVVRETGGLADTVIDADEDEDSGNGFSFDAFEPIPLLHALFRAVAAFREEDRWKAIQRNAMSGDWSWERRAGEYVDLYRNIAVVQAARV